MARGAFTGIATAWLSLIALDAVGRSAGSGQFGGLVSTVTGLVSKALDPNVPAIPDRRTGSPSSGDTATPTPAYRTPADLTPSAPIGAVPSTPIFER